MGRDDEQAVIDTFVEAVHSGERATAERAGRQLVQHHFDGDWVSWVAVCDGTLLRPDEIPSTPAERIDGVVGVEALEAFVSAERLSQLEEEIIDGEGLTAEELAAWRRLAAEDILTENPDCDVYALWGVCRVTHSDGRVAFVVDLGGGYSFTEPWAEYVAGSITEEDALAELRTIGFISVDDFRARSKPDQEQR